MIRLTFALMGLCLLLSGCATDDSISTQQIGKRRYVSIGDGYEGEYPYFMSRVCFEGTPCIMSDYGLSCDFSRRCDIPPAAHDL